MMEVYVKKSYLGRDFSGKALVDWENSGGYTMGVHTDIYGNAISLIKIYEENDRFEVKNTFYIKGINVESCQKYIDSIIQKYNIEQVFGNKLGRQICKIKNSFSVHNGEQYKGYEIIEMDLEEMYFTIQKNLKNIYHCQNLLDWTVELKTFDLNEKNTKCHRLFSVAYVIKNVVPYRSMWDSSTIPGVKIDLKSSRIYDNGNIYYDFEILSKADYKSYIISQYPQ